ncbi:PH domain-containing protein [Gulosibacter sp. 10]|uniref:PH domain-containing protein n=1 Tax=Gulosibacter sp. 10 TaxID=1255570 RepID=UPI00097EA28C|nr:PH domain-containing protein [Gulosibacter sp. 10]SJM48050.1 hypothetical protein FM112_00410 [Gulosibacter sp. 10]
MTQPPSPQFPHPPHARPGAPGYSVPEGWLDETPPQPLGEGPAPAESAPAAPAGPARERRPARPELRVAVIRQHARRLVLPSLVLIAAAGFIGYCSRGLREEGDWLLWANLAGAAGLLLGAMPIIAWLRHRYLVSSVRTVSKKGLLRSAVREIAHHQVVDVRMRRNWWQALFGSGTIELRAVTGRVVVLADVPNAVTVTQALRELTGNVNRAAEREEQPEE